MNRDLDGIYFRVERDGKWQSVCFTDLTDSEIEEISKDRDANWWKAVALHLKECINEIGDAFDITGDSE